MARGMMNNTLAMKCCPICHGSGMWAQGLDEVPCHLCKGTGHVTPNIRQGEDAMPHVGSVHAVKRNRRVGHGK